MRSGSTSTARPVGCGLRRRSRTPFCCTIRPGGHRLLWRRSHPDGDSCIAVRSSGSTPRRSSRSEKAPTALQPCRRRVVLILDNVRYRHASLHRKWRERFRKHFALEFMPPYSPELNPVERVWKLTRRKATDNQYFSTLASVPVAVENVFDECAQAMAPENFYAHFNVSLCLIVPQPVIVF